MTCPNTCDTSSIFESTREARLEAISKAKRDEQARQEQIARLNQIRQSIAVRDAKEQARFQALQDAEKAFKIRERDILEKQLEETLASQKRMQEQYQEFVITTDMIARKLANPAELFKVSTITSVDEFKDYFNLKYKDGRTVKIPFGALDFMLKGKMDAIQDEFSAHTNEIIALQQDLCAANDQIAKMADLFKNLVAGVAARETEQQASFDEFKAEVQKEVCSLKADVTTIAESFKALSEMVESLHGVINTLVASNP